MGQLAKVRVTVRFRLKKWPQMIVLDMSSIILMFALLKDSNILVLLYYLKYITRIPCVNSFKFNKVFVWKFGIRNYFWLGISIFEPKLNMIIRDGKSWISTLISHTPICSYIAFMLIFEIIYILMAISRKCRMYTLYYLSIAIWLVPA